MARRKKNDGTKELATMLTIMIFLGFFLIKWTIEFIVWLFQMIAKFITWLGNKSEQKEKKRKVDNIVNNSFKDSNIKPLKNVEVSDLKKQLNLFDKDIYDDLFEIQIRRRGETYYSEKKIKNVRHTNNKYTCQAEGTYIYKVSIKFNDENINEIETATCTCPYYEDKQKYCKHIYALLLKAKCEENPLKVLQEITSYTDKMSKMIQDITNYLTEKNIAESLSVKTRTEFNNLIENYKSKCTRYSESIEKYKYDEESLLRILENLIEDSSKLQSEIKRLFNSSNVDSTPVVKTKQKEDKLSFTDVAAGLFIANEIDNHFNKDDDYDEELEKEMDNYCLEEWQKEEVRKGNYDPWNFEEDGDLEEDDYYYEDDK